MSFLQGLMDYFTSTIANFLKDPSTLISSAVIPAGAASNTTVGALCATLKFTVNSSSTNNVELKLLQNIMELLNPWAMGIIIVYFTMSFIEMYLSNRGEISLNMIAKNCAALVLADLLINNDIYIVNGILSMFNLALEQVESAVDVTSLQGVSSIPNLSLTAVLINAILLFMIAGLAQGITKITGVIVIIIALATKIEFLLRLSFMPIALGGFASGEYRPQAMRYLRKTVASAFYCFVLVGAVAFGNMAASSQIQQCVTEFANEVSSLGGTELATKYLDAVLYSLIGPFAGIGAFAAAKAIVNEAFGA